MKGELLGSEDLAADMERTVLQSHQPSPKATPGPSGWERPPLPSKLELPYPAGMAYWCRGCEVYGYVGPDEVQQCWACEDNLFMERR